jgi:SAM-dependent methyltransferase
MNNRIEKYHRLWLKKAQIWPIYDDYFQRIIAACTFGKTLEIGGGIGNFSNFVKNVISIDIQIDAKVDVIGDAQAIPFKSSSFNNIAMLDVLHHLENPLLFFMEAQRVVCTEGRIVILEPEITPLSSVFYRIFHDEPVKMNANPFIENSCTYGRDPYEANQAIPTLLFKKHKDQFALKFPNLKVIKTKYLSLFTYPLSGGLRKWSLLPAKIIPTLLRYEDKILPLMGPFMAFRSLIVIEKK